MLSNIKVFRWSNMFFSFSKQNHAESSRNCINKKNLKPKHAKLHQKSWFGHVRTCQDLSRRTSIYCKPAGIFSFIQILHLSIFYYQVYHFIKSCVLSSKSIISIKPCVSIKQIYHFCKVICFTEEIYHFYKIICFY